MVPPDSANEVDARSRNGAKAVPQPRSCFHKIRAAVAANLASRVKMVEHGSGLNFNAHRPTTGSGGFELSHPRSGASCLHGDSAIEVEPGIQPGNHAPAIKCDVADRLKHDGKRRCKRNVLPQALASNDGGDGLQLRYTPHSE